MAKHLATIDGETLVILAGAEPVEHCWRGRPLFIDCWVNGCHTWREVCLRRSLVTIVGGEYRDQKSARNTVTIAGGESGDHSPRAIGLPYLAS